VSAAISPLLAGQRPGAVRAWRNFNPGNIRPPSKRKVHAKMSGIDTTPGGPFLIYASEMDGWRDLADLLLQYREWGWVTVGQIVSKFAPAQDGNNVSFYSRMVMEGLGLLKKGEPPTAEQVVRGLETAIDVRQWAVMDKVTTMIATVEGAPVLGGAKSPPWSLSMRELGFKAAGLSHG
jgi:hypothetical protein